MVQFCYDYKLGTETVFTPVTKDGKDWNDKF